MPFYFYLILIYLLIILFINSPQKFINGMENPPSGSMRTGVHHHVQMSSPNLKNFTIIDLSIFTRIFYNTNLNEFITNENTVSQILIEKRNDIFNTINLQNFDWNNDNEIINNTQKFGANC
ncbi:hypothetical protein Mgra_00004742 [Meloidogyne graminicola]|uniref:Uncharacterized protein n=1 Tax=Meloidogyne graminicola TaxID=189291 RepID=A0A8S9ZQX9_9BILA|nr:hypothetical protein Mgra_00004742 [Meloidogyne graminicola]